METSGLTILETVRAEWGLDFAGACQRFVGRLLTPEPDQFILAMEELAEQVPLPLSTGESLALRDRLVITTLGAAQQFHAQFHHCVSVPCRYSPLTHAVPIAWDDLDALRRLTGMTPSSVREMSDLEATELLASVLSLPQPSNAGPALFQSAISNRQPAIPGVA